MTSQVTMGGALGGMGMGGGGGGGGGGDEWRRGRKRPSHYSNDVSTL